MHVNLLQHCVQAIDMSINLAITLQWTFTDTSTPKRAKQSSNYFGRMVSVFFDDGKKYVGAIVGKDLKSGKWITCFEDGSKDKCDNPAVDDEYTLINQ